jgi:hypothetical protein
MVLCTNVSADRMKKAVLNTGVGCFHKSGWRPLERS